MLGLVAFLIYALGPRIQGLGPRACAMRPFAAVINFLRLQEGMFVTVGHFHPSLIFSSKAGAYQSRAPYGLNLKVGSYSNMQILYLGGSDQKRHTNLLWYGKITAIKSFMVFIRYHNLKTFKKLFPFFNLKKSTFHFVQPLLITLLIKFSIFNF